MRLVVDLGTAQMRAGIPGQRDVVSEPNVVADDASGRQIIGTEAAAMVGRHPEGVALRFPIEAGAVRDFDATVAALRFLVDKLQGQRFARRFDVTISTPTGLTEVERKALKEAGHAAGARKVELFDAALAAAVGAGLPIDQPSGCLVVDLGAGYTEVALLSMGGIVDSRRLSIGGRTVDQGIVEQVRKDFSFALGLRSAEQLKRNYGMNPERASFEVRGRSLQTGLPGRVDVPADLVRRQFAAYYESIVELIVQSMEVCPPELVGDVMDCGIVLVGAGAYAGHVLSGLTRRTDVPVVVADEPETCVIRGLMQAKTTKAGARNWSVPQWADAPFRDVKERVGQVLRNRVK